MSFEKVVRNNLRRSFRTSLIVLAIAGSLFGGNGAALTIMGIGFSLGIFDASTAGILYLALCAGCIWLMLRIVKNGFRRGYELFLHQIDAIGEREKVLERIDAMPRYSLKAAKNAVLKFDGWGIAYAYREAFAAVPAEKLTGTHISSVVRRNDPQGKPLETYLVIDYRDNDSIRIPVADREEAVELNKKLESLYKAIRK